MHIGILGTGYVGLVSGACFSEFGIHVTCADKDEAKIKLLNKGKVPFYEPGLDELVEKNVKKGRLSFTTDVADAVSSSLVVFIAVGTPPKSDGTCDLCYIEDAAKDIAKSIDSYKVIVTKSTVPVGTGKKIKRIIRENLKEKLDFDVASNPEFLREGSAIEDFMRPNRVIIGSDSPQATAILKDLYRPLYLIETPFVLADIETAELIKYAANAFLATKISYINEMAQLCEKIGADVHLVAKGIGLDGRIGPKFLHPGPGFGGSCFPKDTRAILGIAREHGLDFKIVNATVEVNEAQKEFMLSKVKSALNPLKGKTVGVLGLAFKPNTDDIRESPALYIIDSLVKEGAKVKAYDPAAMQAAKKVLPAKVQFTKDAYETAEGGDALVICTEWNEFRNLDPDKFLELLKQPYFFDLRNIYEPAKMRKAGFKYYSVGRP
jgi:UDPglucose 6-dehydrogenase